VRIRFDHAVIHVSDWAVSNDFYRRVLGAELTGEAGGPSAYRIGEQQLNVHGPGVDPHPVARLPVQPGGADLCFEWEGPIDEAIEHLGRQRVEIEEGPVARRGARGEGTSVYFRDPDGALLEFISYRPG
jgi:catechol 2,3-dioxygenase-like lactoylglutathione lyase family enzyme